MTKYHLPYLIISRKKFDTEVSARALEACEQIISEMGADLHDDLVQKISGLGLYLDALERSSFAPAETQAVVHHMRHDFNVITESIRRISRQLRHVRDESDSFEEGVENLCQNLNSSGALRIHTMFEGKKKKIGVRAEIYLGRMTQELVHNAVRHSSAWHVWVRVKWQPECLVIEVEDDGSGFAKISEFISILKKKHNTLRMRALTIGAEITYTQGQKGLLATIVYSYDALK